MPQVTEHEERSVRQYVESQLRDDEDGVTLVQKVGQERVGARSYSTYDVRTVKGRWWVVTDPMNLYDQDAFQGVDQLLTFHLGLQLRIAQSSRVEVEPDRREHAEGAWRRYAAAVEALETADDDAEHFQAVGIHCREALLALARENRTADWVGEVVEAPKGDDLKGWMAIFAATLLPDRRQRSYLKDVADKTWDVAVGLQHNTKATLWDAELTLRAVGHLLHIFMLARVKHERGEPARCPNCGSYRLTQDGEAAEVAGEQGYVQWGLCAACGWTSGRDFESHTAWLERVGEDRVLRYLAGDLEEQQGSAMPDDGFGRNRRRSRDGLNTVGRWAAAASRVRWSRRRR